MEFKSDCQVTEWWKHWVSIFCLQKYGSALSVISNRKFWTTSTSRSKQSTCSLAKGHDEVSKCCRSQICSETCSKEYGWQQALLPLPYTSSGSRLLLGRSVRTLVSRVFGSCKHSSSLFVISMRPRIGYPTASADLLILMEPKREKVS